MTLLAPTNTDLPSSYKIPGVYVQLNLSGSGSAAGDDNRKILVLAYRSATGAFGPDTPKLETQQSDVNSDFGQGSDVARIYAAFQSQFGPGICDVYCCGISEPGGGTAATYTITFSGPATSSGLLDCFVCGYRASIGIANGDTATVVATALAGELTKIADLPVTVSDNGSGTLTLTYRHKGVTGNDLPIMFHQDGGAGIKVSPGTITYANSATGAGSATVTIGATTITVAIANNDTNTTVAANVAAAINGGSYPVTASVNAGVVTLYYANDRPVRRISAAIVTSTVITATLSLHGTAGAGTPTLTNALVNLDALSFGFAAVVTSFNEVTSLGTLSTDIEAQCNGLNQKGEELFFGSVAALATAGALPSGSSPALTASPRYTEAWCRESPQQAYEIAARYAAIYTFSDYFAKNLDGQVLRTRGSVPLLNPAIQDRPPAPDQNAAIRTYYMTPIVVNQQNQLTVLRATTTFSGQNQDLAEVSTMRQLDTARPALRNRLQGLFTGTSYRASNTTPKTPNTVTDGSIKDAIYIWMRELDDQDLFDDAEAWKDALKVNTDPSVNTKKNVFVPLAIIRNLHQLGAVMSPV